MTTYEFLTLLFSIASDIGVVISIWLLYRQNRIFTRQLLSSQSHNITDYSLEISRLFLAHPDLRPYFFEGQAIAEGHADYWRAESLAEVILDILWTMQAEARRIDGREFASSKMRSAWDGYVDSFFAASPVMVSFLTRRGEWYGDEMVSRMKNVQKQKSLNSQ